MPAKPRLARSSRKRMILLESSRQLSRLSVCHERRRVHRERSDRHRIVGHEWVAGRYNSALLISADVYFAYPTALAPRLRPARGRLRAPLRGAGDRHVLSGNPLSGHGWQCAAAAPRSTDRGGCPARRRAGACRSASRCAADRDDVRGRRAAGRRFGRDRDRAARARRLEQRGAGEPAGDARATRVRSRRARCDRDVHTG